MNKIFTIFKKELKRFFTDRRMLLSLIMPGVIMFVIYSLMGLIMADVGKAEENHTYKVVEVNMPNEIKTLLQTDEFNINFISPTISFDEIKKEIQDKKLDLYIEFDENFATPKPGVKPKITILFNSTSNESRVIYTLIYSLISEGFTTVKFDNQDLVTEEATTIQVIQMLLPYLLIIFLFTGCLSVTTESIAGEKERGTINTLLVTPTKRSHIAIGKILALSITALVAATSSLIGLLLSIPTLMKSSGADINIGIYDFGSICLLFVVIILTVILFTTILSIISAFAKNVKEAQQWSSVVMMIVMFLGITSMVGGGKVPTNPVLYLIPIYNSVQAMSSVFAMSIDPICFIVTIISNVALIAVGVFLLARMFNSERIMSSN